MTGAEFLINELKKYSCICYYPSSGIDLSNMDFFCSGKKLWSERVERENPEEIVLDEPIDDSCAPDLFIHTDVNFYQEFESGLDFDADDSGIHGSFEVISFRELPEIKEPNTICDNFDFSGRCFEYKLKLWGSPKIRTLIFVLCENEYLVSKIFLKNKIEVSYIWSKNWNGGQTHGTWLANILDKLKTKKIYTDWLCVPGKRGQPGNRLVEEKYPELMCVSNTKLVRNNEIRWIDEGAHGWVEEFDVLE